eukprot:5205549-Pyramimonas_sp.AAC.1
MSQCAVQKRAVAEQLWALTLPDDLPERIREVKALLGTIAAEFRRDLKNRQVWNDAARPRVDVVPCWGWMGAAAVPCCPRWAMLFLGFTMWAAAPAWPR